jgi:hypothetical protein
MSMRNYIRDADYDCPEPTPDEQLRDSGRRSLFGLLAINALAIIGIVCALVGSAHGQTLQAPTRVSTYDWQCQDANGVKLSDHQRVELAAFACLNNPAGAFVQGGRYRINRPTTPTEPPPPTCPAPPASTTRSQDCPAGTTGTWTQTSASTVSAPPACTVTTTWSPPTPPEGACAPVPPPLTAPTLTGQRTVGTTASNALSWTAVTGATSYVVERCPAAGVACPTMSPIATVTALTYANTGLPTTITYSYRVQPKDATRAGPYSNTWTATVEPPPTGANTVRINVGGPALADYGADQYFTGGSVSSSCNRTVSGVYATRRFSSSGFEYRIPLPNARYLVRLLWQECWHTGAGQRVLNASVEGLAIAAVDPWRSDGAPTSHERIVDLIDGTLNIALTAETGDAMLNAIEVTPTTDQPTPQPTFSTTLSWTPPTENTDGTTLTNLAGYRLLYGTSAGALTRALTISNPSTLSTVVDGLTQGTWYFAIVARSSAGTESAPTNAASRVIP